MHQFFVDKPLPPLGAELEISDDQVKHMQVLRLKKGEKLLLSDESRLVEGQLLFLDKNKAKVQLIAEHKSTEPPYNITLFQGLPKGDKLDFIIQKAVELGVNQVVPVQTSLSVTRWDKDKSLSKIERLNRIALEAAKQAHRVKCPQVESLLLWPEFVEKWHNLSGLKLIFWESAAADSFFLKQVLKGKPSEVFLFVGPEGGLAEEEIRALGSPYYSLGPRILRTETASLAALAIVMYSLELKGEDSF